MSQPCFIVLDCGATNARAIAVDRHGHIIARASQANPSQPDSVHATWHQWSVDDILKRFIHCCQQVVAELTDFHVVGLTVTTFGVDGAWVDEQGKLISPLISWKCPRTQSSAEQVWQQMSPARLQQLSGVGQFTFNTLFKLAWLGEHRPDDAQRAHAWLFISSLFNQRLTGEFTTDLTMAGTSQLLDISQQDFSPQILAMLGIPREKFPRFVAPGEVIGGLLPDMAQALHLPAGIPVISTGHDTQFALFGAGAGINEPVLSSGTWEILMVRSAQTDTHLLSTCPASTCELDSQLGYFNPGMQYLASGVLEWIKGLFWQENTSWEEIIQAAAAIPAGAEGVTMQCQLLAQPPISGWQGVTLNTRPAHFYRAALEALTETLAGNLATLEKIAGFSAQELLLVGGGSRNALWNQMKADRLQLPLRVSAEPETTVLGASLYGWWGVGEYDSADAARDAVDYRYHYVYPGKH